MVPTRTFESYTPVELSLRKLTLENPRWNLVYPDKDRLERLFNQFVNQNFPLQIVDVGKFEDFVSQNPPQTSPLPMTEEHRLWHASHPHGQKFENYPLVDNDCDFPTSFSLLRER